MKPPVVVAVACRGAYAAFLSVQDGGLTHPDRRVRRVGPRHPDRIAGWLRDVVDAARVELTHYPGAWPARLDRDPDLPPAYLAMVGPRAGQRRSDYPPLVAGALLADGYCRGWLASRSLLVPPYPHDPTACLNCADPAPDSGSWESGRCEEFVRYGERGPAAYPERLHELAASLPADAARAALAAYDIAGTASRIIADHCGDDGQGQGGRGRCLAVALATPPGARVAAAIVPPVVAQLLLGGCRG